MALTTDEQWVLTLEALSRPTPVAVRVRRLLKYALRQLGFKCVRLDEPGEMKRLRQRVEALTERCARQSELLSRQAEQKHTG